LAANGYPEALAKKWTHENHDQRRNNDHSSKVFYLSVPFINDGVNRLVRKAIAPMGLNIRLAHKGLKLQSWIKPQQKRPNNCLLRKCFLKTKDCCQTNVVYESKCTTCNASYIGSTLRNLHIRINEHHNLRSSAMFQHRLVCQGEWITSFISRGKDVTDLRLKEAILINSKRLMLNKKEEADYFQLVL
jgi:predicted GIY-YIG superfamily endonuclease